ncbi:hypothetical protein, partial [Escherichia coli]|uniref:hypothetical protein n=1 Tax=Escherichia coli TaxID=562 RepID=UPI00227A6163
RMKKFGPVMDHSRGMRILRDVTESICQITVKKTRLSPAKMGNIMLCSCGVHITTNNLRIVFSPPCSKGFFFERASDTNPVSHP